MLEQILMHLHNWFVLPGGIHQGTFSIEGGHLALSFLLPGQYYRIVGSVFNDGLHRYPKPDFEENETFTGEVWALAIPREVIGLAEEIEAWQEAYGACAASPYTSESFGGYSCTLATGKDGTPLRWQDVFRTRLNPWRSL